MDISALMIAPLIQRKKASSAAITIVEPISKNKLRAFGRGRFIDSARYKTWKRTAGWELEQQRPPSVPGGYELRIIVSRSFGLDLSNAETAISDLLQAHGVIENDRQCQHLEMDWGDDPGVKIIVTSAKKAEAA